MLSFLKNLVVDFLKPGIEDIEDNDLELNEEKIFNNINADVPVPGSPSDFAPNPKTLGQSEPGEFDVEIYKSVNKTGKVTFINNDYGIIDNTYYFEPGQVSGPFNLEKNDEVTYTAYKAKENENERIFKIYPLKNDLWTCDDKPAESNVGNQTNAAGETEKVEEIPALSRVLNGRVTARKGRKIFIEPSNIWCNLDEIEASYIPFEGDWVSLEASVTINEDNIDLCGDILKVVSLTPLVTKTGIGRVTFWSNLKNEGVIENFLYFTQVICENGYVPNLGDEVIYDAIESDQDKFKWRALKVYPNELSNNFSKQFSVEHNTFSNKNEISIKLISCTVELELHKTKTIVLEVTNKGTSHQVLKKVRFNLSKQRSQLILKSPNLIECITIKPEDTLRCSFECRGRYLGLSREVCTFYFDNFTINKTFEINVVGSNEMNKLLSCNIDTVFKVSVDKKYVKNNLNAETVLYGPRPWKPPKFAAGERRGVYTVPNKLWEAVVGDSKLPKTKTESLKALLEYAPYLKEDLNPSRYSDWFHTLLYLEEIEIKMNFRNYDMQGAFLLRQGDFLVLEVPGLIERRPSLIPGDKIILSQPWSESNNVQQVGYIHEIHQKDVYVKFHQSFHHSYDESDCDIIFEPNLGALSRSHDAINRSMKKLGLKWLFPSAVNEKPPQIELELPEDTKTISESVASFFTEVSKNQKIGVECDDECVDPKNVLTVVELEEKKRLNRKKKLAWYNKSLNERQKMAVINVLKGQGRPLPYIIFGPPGTGKTITMVEVVMQIYHLIPESRILITTPSNSSADLICERLIEFGNFKPGQLVRLLAYSRYTEGKSNEKLIPYSTVVDMGYDARKNQNPIVDQDNIRSSKLSQLVGRHRITVGTCVCIGSLHYLGFPSGHFTHILVDEAGQATEPELLISASFQNVRSGQVVLTGDPQQLGPVCLSGMADRLGLGVSLLQRFVSTFPYLRDFDGFPETSGYDSRFITRLNVNYRSVPEILSLPSQLFYNSELIPTVSQTEGTEADIIEKFNAEIEDREKPPAIIFHGICGQNYQESDSPSWYNPHEVWQVVSYLRKCYTTGLTCDDVGVITPYAKQVMKIRTLLTALNLSAPKIGTVEDFQGQERYVIIVSTVRSSWNFLGNYIRHALGFVANPRRLNVALTRARALIIILGNPYLLSADPYWKNVVEYCIKNKSYTGCSFDLIEKPTTNKKETKNSEE